MEAKLYVGNLPYSTTEDDLRSLFGQAGTVKSVSLITDRESGRSKGFGFVEMESADEAEQAISMLNGSELNGRALTVNIAKPREERPRRSFNRSGSGGGGNRNFNRSRDDDRRR